MTLLELREKLKGGQNQCDHLSYSLLNSQTIRRKRMKGKGRLPAVELVRVSEEKINCSNSKNIKPWKIQNVQRAGCSSFLSVAVIKLSKKKKTQLGR